MAMSGGRAGGNGESALLSPHNKIIINGQRTPSIINWKVAARPSFGGRADHQRLRTANTLCLYRSTNSYTGFRVRCRSRICVDEKSG